MVWVIWMRRGREGRKEGGREERRRGWEQIENENLSCHYAQAY